VKLPSAKNSPARTATGSSTFASYESCSGEPRTSLSEVILRATSKSLPAVTLAGPSQRSCAGRPPPAVTCFTPRPALAVGGGTTGTWSAEATASV